MLHKYYSKPGGFTISILTFTALNGIKPIFTLRFAEVVKQPMFYNHGDKLLI